jgi:hypothetical protein
MGRGNSGTLSNFNYRLNFVFCQPPKNVTMDKMMEFAKKSIAIATPKLSCWNLISSPKAGTF